MAERRSSVGGMAGQQRETMKRVRNQAWCPGSYTRREVSGRRRARQAEGPLEDHNQFLAEGREKERRGEAIMISRCGAVHRKESYP